MRMLIIAGLAGVLIGGVLFGSAVGVIQQARINGLEDSLAGVTLERDTLRGLNAQCAADVLAAQEGWAEYRRQQDARAESVREALAAAEGRASSAERRARDLANRPPAGETECAAADDLLGEYLRGRQ